MNGDSVQKEKLNGMLRVSEDGLTPDEQKKVREFVLEAYDMLALSELEKNRG